MAEKSFEINAKGEVWADDGMQSVRIVTGPGIEEPPSMMRFLTTAPKRMLRKTWPEAALPEEPPAMKLSENNAEEGPDDDELPEDDGEEYVTQDLAPRRKKWVILLQALVFLLAVVIGVGAALGTTDKDKDGDTTTKSVTLEDCLFVKEGEYSTLPPAYAPTGENTTRADEFGEESTASQSPSTASKASKAATTNTQPDDSAEESIASKAWEATANVSNFNDNDDESVRRDLRGSSAANRVERLTGVSSKRRKLTCEELLASKNLNLNYSSKTGKSSKSSNKGRETDTSSLSMASYTSSLSMASSTSKPTLSSKSSNKSRGPKTSSQTMAQSTTKPDG